MLICNFCGRPQDPTKFMIEGKYELPSKQTVSAHICEDCVMGCVELVAKEKTKEATNATDNGNGEV